MTILRSEASPGGLQVQNRAGEWLDAPSVEGAYVINIGDAFMRWTIMSADLRTITQMRAASPKVSPRFQGYAS